MKILLFFLIIPLFSSFSIPPRFYSISPIPPTFPIIGVLTQPSSWVSLYDPLEYSYIAASYVKALEAAGARVVPVKYDWDDAKILEVFEGLNGLLLPGGGTELTLVQNQSVVLSNYAIKGKKILQLAKEINEKGEYFPVWGTCLGFELMALSFSEDVNVLENNFLSLNYGNSLEFLQVFISFLFKFFLKIRYNRHQKAVFCLGR